MMNETLGTRIAMCRKEKGLKQDEVAEMLGVSPQAVSKWENDQTCPDISLLPQLSRILGVSVDELLCGKQEPVVQIQTPEERKDVRDMFLRLIAESGSGDKIKLNLPIALIKMLIETGMELPQISGGNAFKNIDLKQIMALVEQGVIGNLLEAETADGDVVRIFVE